jgi:hypothetical protein
MFGLKYTIWQSWAEASSGFYQELPLIITMIGGKKIEFLRLDSHSFIHSAFFIICPLCNYAVNYNFSKVTYLKSRAKLKCTCIPTYVYILAFGQKSARQAACVYNKQGNQIWRIFPVGLLFTFGSFFYKKYRKFCRDSCVHTSEIFS